jgi:hypothetical protein
MPNDRNEWAQRIPEFLVEAETLLAKTEECLSHLQLISNDKDAIDCMRSTLLKLANKADALALAAFPNFPAHTRLAQSCPGLYRSARRGPECASGLFHPDGLAIELVDHNTGQLSLDAASRPR